MASTNTATNNNKESTTTDDEAALVTALSSLNLQQEQPPVVNFTPNNETTSTHENGKPQPETLIHDLSSLSSRLPDICNAIFQALGSQQLEASYQRCLALDLENAGLVVHQEVELALLYKNHVVGSRRADLIIEIPSSHEQAILELKAVSTLTPSHARQLQYYMHHFGIHYGYLVNFPHESGFPFVQGAVFRLTSLSGSIEDAASLDTPVLRFRNNPSDTTVQVIQFTRLEVNSKEAFTVLENKKQRAAIAQSNKNPKVWGITSTGLPCKICQEEEAFCRYHQDQAEPQQQEETASSVEEQEESTTRLANIEESTAAARTTF